MRSFSCAHGGFGERTCKQVDETEAEKIALSGALLSVPVFEQFPGAVPSCTDLAVCPRENSEVSFKH